MIIIIITVITIIIIYGIYIALYPDAQSALQHFVGDFARLLIMQIIIMQIMQQIIMQIMQIVQFFSLAISLGKHIFLGFRRKPLLACSKDNLNIKGQK